MTAPVYIRGRIRRDVQADAAKAARLCIEDGVDRKCAMERYRIGWVTLCAAIKKLRDERGIAGSRSQP